MEQIVFIVTGILLVGIGILNMQGNISTIKWYNRRRVSEEDIPKYGRAMGLGTLVFGASLLLTGVLRIFVHAEAILYLILAGGAVGLAVILYAQFRYNRGIF